MQKPSPAVCMHDVTTSTDMRALRQTVRHKQWLNGVVGLFTALRQHRRPDNQHIGNDVDHDAAHSRSRMVPLIMKHKRFQLWIDPATGINMST